MERGRFVAAGSTWKILSREDAKNISSRTGEEP
jgi:hypothetical protein